MRNFYMYENHAEETVIKTIHGSHLYGLAHANSDSDYYEVFLGGTGYMKRYAEQHPDHNGEDIMRIHLDRFLENAAKGAPQALETLWSPYAEIHPLYQPFLKSFRPDFNLTRDRYRRTILNFAFNHGGRSATRAQLENNNHREKFKLARHSLRLTLNLNDFIRDGHFSPTLNEFSAEYITAYAEHYESDDFKNKLNEMLEAAMNGELKLH